jgi:hypothetical protein
LGPDLPWISLLCCDMTTPLAIRLNPFVPAHRPAHPDVVGRGLRGAGTTIGLGCSGIDDVGARPAARSRRAAYAVAQRA